MKQTFTLITLLFITVAATAQNKAKLSISVAGNVATRVQIDNVRYKLESDDLILNSIEVGKHTVKIYQYKNRVGNQRSGNGPNNNYLLIYTGTLTIKPQTHTDITVNRFGKAFVDEMFLNKQYNNNDDDDWSSNDNWNDNNNSNNEIAVMNASTFDQFKQTIRNEFSDDSKTKTIKQYMPNSLFTTTQIKELLQLFSFETIKLDVAKFAYKYTVDKSNYFIINNVFFNSSSKSELMEYIKNNP